MLYYIEKALKTALDLNMFYHRAAFIIYNLGKNGDWTFTIKVFSNNKETLKDTADKWMQDRRQWEEEREKLGESPQDKITELKSLKVGG